MAKKSDAAADTSPPWYEVLEQSYIGDRLYQAGDRVQFDGDAGPNLRALSADELKVPDRPKTDDDLLIDRAKDLDLREKDLDKRESDIADREKAVDAKEQELEAEAVASDQRAKDLDAREVAVAAREAAAPTDAK